MRSSVRDLLDNGNYMILNKSLVKIIGLIETVYLCALIDKERALIQKDKELKKEHKKSNCIDDEGYFKCNQESIFGRTDLTSYQQSECKNILIDLGLLKCVKRGLPATNWYYIDYDKILEIIDNNDSDITNDQSPTQLGTTSQRSKAQAPKRVGHIIKKINSNKDKLVKNNSPSEFDEKEELLYNSEEGSDTIGSESGGQEDTSSDTPTPPKILKNIDEVLSTSSKDPASENKPRKAKKLSGAENLRVFDVFKTHVCPTSKVRSESVIEGIPRVIAMFNEEHGKDGLEKLIDVLTGFKRTERYRWLSQDPLRVTAKVLLSKTFIEDNFLPLSFNQKQNDISYDEVSDEELRQIEADNQERVRKYFSKPVQQD